jgi:tetrahydromethanopterin S-methyltransferase subunit G
MSSFDNLDDTFNIIPHEIEEESSIVNISSDLEDIEADYEYSRNELYKLIKKGQKAIDGIIDVASSSDHPRAYEVAFQGMKHVSDMTDKLIDLQKKMKSIEGDVPQKGPSTINNTMFVGSTAELQKFIKQSKINNIEE